jgi:enediyne biosynthesis protein E4
MIGALLAAFVLVAVAWATIPGREPSTGASAEAAGAPRYVEEAIAAGADHRYDGEFTFVVGGGVAVLDCDDDGLPDLYFAGGARPAALFRNVSRPGGELRFTRVPDGATDLLDVTGAYPLDVDGDGRLDLAVLRVGENVLLRGRGDCTFERANEAWGFDGGDAWTTAFSATWEDDSTFPTLAFGNYLLLDETGDPTFDCDDSALVRPEAGGGGFAAPIELTPSWCTLSMLFTDWDRTGRHDLRASNDRHYYRDGSEQLWRVEPGADPEPWTDDDGWQTVRIWGMGIASRDLTGDGRPEVYLTSQGDNKLQTLVGSDGRPEYADIALRSGATAHRPYEGDTTMPSTAWHPEFADVNNDGFVDLFVSKGNVEAQTDHAARDPNNLLLGQPDGTFVEAASDAGIVAFQRARGAALVDLNLDGRLDIVVVNRRENVSVWRNTGIGTDGESLDGRWLAVRPVQPGANRDAVGAWIEARAGDRAWSVERTVGGGHASGQLGWVHLGLGDAATVEVRVVWPDGEAGPWHSVDTDGWAVVDRASGEARRATPGEGEGR